MNAAGKRMRAAVFERAEGVCECGCGRSLGEGGQLDHFFGRGKAEESEANCWAIRWDCHADKTASRPSARHWLEAFRKHAWVNGYEFEADKADMKIAVLIARKFA